MSQAVHMPAERIRELMKQGHDTLSIAEMVNAALGRRACTEADIYNTLGRADRVIAPRSAA
jgi:hypothetical protein